MSTVLATQLNHDIQRALDGRYGGDVDAVRRAMAPLRGGARRAAPRSLSSLLPFYHSPAISAKSGRAPPMHHVEALCAAVVLLSMCVLLWLRR